MRIAVHDYAGHPFPVELSRELAHRGYDILHLYSSAITSPRGALTHAPDDPDTFAVEPIDLGTTIDRDRLFRRRQLEAEHGRRVVQRLKAFSPDVVLSSNTPLEAQLRIWRYCKREKVGFVYWVQDLIGEAASRLLRERIIVGAPVAWHYRRLERRLLWNADAVVVISDDFLPFVPVASTVIENWAPLKDLPVEPKANPWAEAHGMDRSTNLLYTGTLGMKHDPTLLVRAAAACADDETIKVVVASEGRAADWLREQSELGVAKNLVVLPFQPYEQLSQMLASADVLIAILEPDAGVFSVPSKVLSYLCAGRPLLLVVPPENLAAKIVSESEAGIVVPPGDELGLENALATLLADPKLRAAMGARARAYAERTFDLTTIADRFETVVEHASAAAHRSPRPSTSPVRAERAAPGRNGDTVQRSDCAFDVSVIIVTYNCGGYIVPCLESLAAEGALVSLEVIVIDNASRDGTAETIAAKFPWVRLVRNTTNDGFARAANRGLALAEGRHVLLLNPDTMTPPGTLRATIDGLDQNPDVGMLGCKLIRLDGTFDGASKRGLPTVSSAFFYFSRIQRLFPRSRRFAGYTAGYLDEDSSGVIEAVNGAFMLVRREALEDVGPLDERYWLYGEDLDWCLRFGAHGWKILYWPTVSVTHLKGASDSGYRAWRTNVAFYRSMWLYYDKHLAPRHVLVVSALVRCGIWANFVGAVSRTSVHQTIASVRRRAATRRAAGDRKH